MIIVLVALYAMALVAPLFFRKMGRNAFYILALAPAAGFVWLLATLGNYLAPNQAGLPGAPDSPESRTLSWVPQIGLNIDLRMDALSATLSILILGIGALVLAYCAKYFKKDDPNLGPFGAQLLAFAASMFGLVISDNLLLLFVFWELTTILSYLLIGYSRTKLSARTAALEALIVTTFGGLAMLVGMVLIGTLAGTFRISDILAQAPDLVTNEPLVSIAVVLMLIGAVSKSALVPFHFWLPGAMAAPTPVSAYLHAAAMVKAGIYLVARLAPGFAELPAWQWTVMTLGLATMLIGGWRAMRQFDMKLILAYGTVSQLGFMMMIVGLGGQEGALAGLLLLVAHAFFKATLFLVVGIIDHQAGTRDIRDLAGLYQSIPKVTWIAGIAAASMAAVPPLLGFVSKEAVYQSFWNNAVEHGGVAWVLMVGIVLGSVLTFAYSARFMWGGFSGKQSDCVRVVRPVSWSFVAAPGILALGTIVFGVYPQAWAPLFEPYAQLFPLPEGEKAPYIALWHGFTPALWLSVLTLALGVAAFFGRKQVWRVQNALPGPVESRKLYNESIFGVDELARWVTGKTQRGSLTFYLFVILAAAIVTPWGVMAVNGINFQGSIYAWDTPVQVIVGATMIVGAIAAIRAGKRFMAVILVSVTGYGTAVLFALQGAPDLALTQLLVETIVLVAFVLALRVLPASMWGRRTKQFRRLRAVTAALSGLTIMVVTMLAMGSRIFEPISLNMPKLAYEVGGGHNTVNVTLVDIRAWDTFGEVSVLAIAATGVASLIFIRGRSDMRIRASHVQSGTVGRNLEQIVEPGREYAARRLAEQFYVAKRNPWLVAGRTLAPERRSIVLEIVTRLLFHSIMVVSIFLLLTGHNTPGGGFAGGLTAGLAMTIRYLAGGRIELAEASPATAGTMLGIGLGTVSLSALIPVLLGGNALQQAIITFYDVPVFGDIKFATSTIFDIGVYLIVVGLILDVVRSFGSHLDLRAEQDGGSAPQGSKEKNDGDASSGASVTVGDAKENPGGAS